MKQIIFINSEQRREVIKSFPMPLVVPSSGNEIKLGSKYYRVIDVRWDYDGRQLLVFVKAVEPPVT